MRNHGVLGPHNTKPKSYSHHIMNRGDQNGRPRKSRRSNGGYQHGGPQDKWSQNTRPNKAECRIGNHKNNGNENYQGQKNLGKKNKRPLCANRFGKLLSPLTFDFATLRALLSVVFSMSDVLWAAHGKRGKSARDIAKELGLPLLDCVRLYNFSDSLLEMAQGPDDEGDIPMLDIDGVVVSSGHCPTLDGPSGLLWELITTHDNHTQV